MKIKLGIICVVITALLSGCRFLPPPTEAVSPPRADINISSDNNDSESIVAGFLPEDVFLVPIKCGSDMKAVNMEDLDGDGADEIIATYKYNGMSDSYYTVIMVLKKCSSTWEKIYDNASYFTGATGGIIKHLDFKDITGDGAPEVFIVRDRSLEVYITVKNREGKSVVGVFPFSSLKNYEVGDIPGVDGQDGIKELLVKGDISQNPQGTVVMRWTGFTLADVTRDYPIYLKEEIDYLTGQVKESPADASKWSKLESAQEKAGMYEDAFKSCDKMIELNKEPQQAKYLSDKRAYLLLRLGRYDDVMKEYRTEGQEYSPAQHRLAQVYEATGEYDKAREIYKSIASFPYDDDIQRVDAVEGEEKIYNFLRDCGTEGIEKAAIDLKAWGQDNNMVVNCTAAAGDAGGVNGILVVDYHIDPSKAFGKENVGGHIIYWWEEGKLYHQGYMTLIYIPELLNKSFNEVLNEGLDEAFTAAEASLYKEGNDTALKVVYKDEVRGRTADRVYRLKNGQWKLFSK